MSFISEISKKAASVRKRTVRNTSRLFADSLTLSTADRIRRSFLTLSLNVCGMFFLTFGIYTSASAMLLHFMRSSFAGNVSLFSGIVMALASVPVLFSKDNVSTALSCSHAGNALCECIGVRMVSFVHRKKTGHLNQGFALGVIAGTASMILSTWTVLLVILMITVCCTVFALPCAGVMFFAAALPFFPDPILGAVCIVTALSFLIKILRGKRSVRIHAPEAAFLLFTLCVIIIIVTGPEILNVSAWKFIVFLWPYLLSSLVLRNCRNSVHAMLILVGSCGLLSLVFCLGYGTDALTGVLLPDSGIYGGFIMDAILKLRVFSTGYATVLACAAIPLSVGAALRSDHSVPGIVLWFCAAADAVFLTLTESLEMLFLAFVVTFILLMVYGKKWVYICSCAALPMIGLVLYLTGSWRIVVSFFSGIVSTATADFGRYIGSLSELSAGQFILGTHVLNGDGGNFYTHIISSFGIIGFVLFAAFLVITLAAGVSFLIKTIRIGKNSEIFKRFGSVRSAADTRLGCFTPVSSAFIILAAGIFKDLFESGALYMMLWLLLGISAAYRRSAGKEIEKAENAENCNKSRHCAETTIRL